MVNIRDNIRNIWQKTKSPFIKKSDVSDKVEVNGRSFKLLIIALVFIFIVTVILLPNSKPVQFQQKIARSDEGAQVNSDSKSSAAENKQNNAAALWGDPRPSFQSSSSDQINRNTPMILTGNNNSKTQVPAGERLHLKLLDGFTVTDDSVPVLAELTFDAVTDSGLSLPTGTEFYGEARFDKETSRIKIDFKQISLPDGEIRSISGIAVSSDGEPGISGNVHSDVAKNTAGELITSFVGGFAAGSMQTNVFGQSVGGVQNGLLQATGDTARNLADNYGNKLKTEREWITIRAGAEFDAILNSSLNLQIQPSDTGLQGGDSMSPQGGGE